MKANNNIDVDLLDNLSDFSDPFFKQFTVAKREAPLELTPSISKDYLFPTFYGDTSCAIAVFLCDYEQAKKLLPHSSLKPVSMLKGRALITFSCYQYRNVLGVAPYNEIAMTIPVMTDDGIDMPLLPMVAEKLFKNFGYHVFHMPVTSLENQIRGRKIWGLPKVVDDINIDVVNDVSHIAATDEWGNEYFSLKVPTNGKPVAFDVRSNLYSVLDGELKQSATQFKGKFNLIKHMDRLFKSGGDDPGVLKIGEGPYGDMLKKLKIEPQPFQFRHANSMNACFELPNKNFNG